MQTNFLAEFYSLSFPLVLEVLKWTQFVAMVIFLNIDLAFATLQKFGSYLLSF